MTLISAPRLEQPAFIVRTTTIVDPQVWAGGGVWWSGHRCYEIITAMIAVPSRCLVVTIVTILRSLQVISIDTTMYR